MRTAYVSLCSTVVLCAALAACATPEPVKTATDTTRANIGGAVSAPLQDFNVVRTQIPVVLLEAKSDVYARPNPLNCGALAIELGRLDDALGPDIDIKKAAKSRSDRGAEYAANAGVAAVKDVAEGWIPMKSWVRYMTGAQQHDEAVQSAIAAGRERRSYLKGLAQSLGCIGIGPKPTKLFPAPPVTPSTVTNVALTAKP
ncbi:MAG TPA: hypothetical protein VMU59_15320 [Caulobacteraceae bacterium]|nr:hypothetical protein [Caulobacteraceae bacterium]